MQLSTFTGIDATVLLAKVCRYLGLSLVPHHYGLHLSIEIILRGVESMHTRWTTDWRLGFDVALASYAAWQHTHRHILTVIELRTAAAASDLISDSHSYKVFKLLIYHLLSPPIM